MFGRRDFFQKMIGAAAAGVFGVSTKAHSAAVSPGAPIAPDSSLNGEKAHTKAVPAPEHQVGNVLDPTYVDTRLDCRSVSFENPTGGRGAGGQSARGRKGHAFHVFKPGEKATLADLTGPGTIRHIWMTAALWRPEVMRSLRLEVFYDAMPDPSISVPLLDFFGLPHGRLAEFYSALINVNEGRGLNSTIPMPFRRSVRVEFTNESDKHVSLYYQVDYTLGPSEHMNYLHVSFRRENPTVLRRDFVITEGLKGPGRFLGCSVGIRPIEKSSWYGEGEVKIYRDGDADYPTYCGTGLEDYAGSAYGLRRHSSMYSGAPLNNPIGDSKETDASTTPDFMSFYRWHLPDPVMFSKDLRVTIQQIGSGLYLKDKEDVYNELRAKYPDASYGWMTDLAPGVLGFGLYERIDDYCATAFVYCRAPQAVPRYLTDPATRDIALLPSEASDKAYKYVDIQDGFNAEMLKRWGE